jgi:hypothetical protein
MSAKTLGTALWISAKYAQIKMAAISALIDSLDPKILVLPQSIVDVIPPRPPNYRLDRESFARSTGDEREKVSKQILHAEGFEVVWSL